MKWFCGLTGNSESVSPKKQSPCKPGFFPESQTLTQLVYLPHDTHPVRVGIGSRSQIAEYSSIGDDSLASWEVILVLSEPLAKSDLTAPSFFAHTFLCP